MNLIHRKNPGFVIFLSLVISVILLSRGTLSADPITSTWSGGSGNWSDPLLWILPEVPTSGSQVLIDNTTPASVVTVDIPTAQLNNVGIASQATLTLAADLSAGELTSYGTVNVGSGATLNAGSGGFVQDTSTAATMISSGGSFLDTGTYSQGNGSIVINGQMTTPLFHVTGGTVTTGGTGVLTIGSGGYTQDSSVTTQINAGGQMNLTGDYAQGNGSTIVNGTLTTALLSVTGGSVSVGSGGVLTTGSGGYAQGVAGTSTTIAAGGQIDTVGGTYGQEIGTSTIIDGTLTATAVNNSGTVTGSGTVDGDFNNLGTLAPGDSGIGSLGISGNYFQSGFLVADLSDSDSGDVLNVGGDATLGGTLDLSLQDGFVPTLGETFLVMTYGADTGNFYDIESALPANEYWDASYDAGDLYVTVDAGSPAAAPEPPTFLLLATGYVGLLWTLKRVGRNRKPV